MDYNKLGNIGPLINSVQVNILMHLPFNGTLQV